MSDNNSNSKKIAIIFFYIMFIYSGFDKIIHFSDKVNTLTKKISLPRFINSLAMVCVILLEIIGSFIIILYSLSLFTFPKIPKIVVKITYILFMIFLIVVTSIYHPPISMKKLIPFLSNVTTFSGLLYMYSDYFLNE